MIQRPFQSASGHVITRRNRHCIRASSGARSGALFVAAGGYHHHLGLNIWAGRHGPPAPVNAVGLRSFGIAIPGEAAWKAAIERFQASGTAVTPGQHDDEPTSHTVQDPDGLKVELLLA
jgi:catechol 2,3-dioxygenase